MTTFIASAVRCTDGLHPNNAACAYQIAWAINPHMVVGSAAPDRAAAQHLALLRTVRTLSAVVTEVPFVHGAFDSVFAKDNAIYLKRHDRTHVLLGSPRYDVRQVEQHVRARDLELAGATVHTSLLPFEGGDVCMLPGARGAILGHGFRSSARAGDALEEFLGLPVTTLELVDRGSITSTPPSPFLGDGTALFCADAFTPPRGACSRHFRCAT